MSTSTATAYKNSVAGHLSFGAPKCEKAQKSSGFWANRTYWLCIKDNVLIDPANDCYICPLGGMLRHTTTDRDGKRTYRSIPKECVTCHIKAKCGANEKGQKLYTSHIWQEHLDLVEALRKTERGKELYAKRKETIERVFADAKEKHAMRYTHHRGLARVTGSLPNFV